MSNSVLLHASTRLRTQRARNIPTPRGWRVLDHPTTRYLQKPHPWRLGQAHRWGAALDPLLPHAYLQGGCVSGGLGVHRYVCDNSAFWSLPGRKA